MPSSWNSNRVFFIIFQPVRFNQGCGQSIIPTLQGANNVLMALSGPRLIALYPITPDLVSDGFDLVYELGVGTWFYQGRMKIHV